MLSEYFDVESAHEAGFFDELAWADELTSRAEAKALELGELDERALTATKRRMVHPVEHCLKIRWIRYSIPLDLFDAMMMGVRGARPR